jgi:hypothetical protein
MDVLRHVKRVPHLIGDRFRVLFQRLHQPCIGSGALQGNSPGLAPVFSGFGDIDWRQQLSSESGVKRSEGNTHAPSLVATDICRQLSTWANNPAGGLMCRRLHHDRKDFPDSLMIGTGY